MTRARQLVASAVVLVLTGTPLAASACALWCPPSDAAAATAVVELSGSANGLAADEACAATHHHAAAPASPQPTRAGGARADREAHDAADALPTVPSAALASPACCDVVIADGDGIASGPALAFLLLHAPLPSTTHPVDRDGARVVTRVAPSPRPAPARTSRALVLRI